MGAGVCAVHRCNSDCGDYEMEDEMSEMMDIVKQVSENVAQHIEEFAAAFAKRTGLDPTKIKMVSSIRGYRHEVWFEPFPSITEIEQYRKRAELAEAELARRDEIIARLKEDGERLAAQPYPFTDVEHIESGTYCHYCHKSNKFEHDDFCPITLHRALMKELE